MMFEDGVRKLTPFSSSRVTIARNNIVAFVAPRDRVDSPQYRYARRAC